MRYLFVRHGQTDWNVAWRLQGSTDIPLNETGRRQAEEQADKLLLGNHHIEKIYTSKKLRASETAQIIAGKLQCDCEILEGIEEMNFGDWEGRSWDDIKEKYADNYLQWETKRYDTVVINGESCEMVLKRTLRALSRIPAVEKDVLIVTHGAVLMTLQCYLKNIPFEEFWTYLPGNGEVLELDIKKGNPIL